MPKKIPNLSIEAMARTRRVFDDRIIVEDLEHVRPAIWSKHRRAMILNDESIPKGAIPCIDFNVLQACKHEPETLDKIIQDKQKKLHDEFGLEGERLGSDEYLKRVGDLLAELSLSPLSSDVIGADHRFRVWERIVELHPEQLSDCIEVGFISFDYAGSAKKERQMTLDESDQKTQSAAEVSW